MSDTGEPPPWRWSVAKQLLTQDILQGRTNGKQLQEVHEMRAEYRQYDYDKFKTNFRNLKDTLQKNQKSAIEDAMSLMHDKLLHVGAGRDKPYPRWQGSAAERLLKLDIDRGLHKRLLPHELRAHKDRAEYRKFPLKVFRDHIYQELQNRKERSYWLAWKKEKEEEKRRKGQRRKK